MKPMHRIIIALASVVIPASASAEITLGGKTAFVFANVEQGRKILCQRDEFLQRLSPFDRSARMKTDRPVSQEAYLQFLATNVLSWTDEERATVESALKSLQPSIEALALPWPEAIYLIKTTGNEEAGACYTRSNAIVLPAKEMEKSAGLSTTLAHELFHVLSRHNPALQEKLYAAIGFQKCQEAPLPSRLQARKITNPDAPKNDCCIRVRVNGRPVWVTPVLYSSTTNYDTTGGGEFLEYLEFKLLVIERARTGSPPRVIYDDANPQLLDVSDVSDYFEQVGRNTGYIIHPEEILAENFRILVRGEKRIASPDVMEKIKTVLGVEPARPQ